MLEPECCPSKVYVHRNAARDRGGDTSGDSDVVEMARKRSTG
jgi:hypothetical protein